LPARSTALMTAAGSGSVEAVKALLDHGADVNAQETARGETALMFAAAANRGPVVSLLLKRGANAALPSRLVRLGRVVEYGERLCCAGRLSEPVTQVAIGGVTDRGFLRGRRVLETA